MGGAKRQGWAGQRGKGVRGKEACVVGVNVDGQGKRGRGISGQDNVGGAKVGGCTATLTVKFCIMCSGIHFIHFVFNLN